MVLRPGGVTAEMIRQVLGSVKVAGSVLRPLKPDEKVLSPGMKYRHYSPDGQVTLVDGAPEAVVAALQLLYTQATENGHRACVMCFEEHAEALRDCQPHLLGSIRRPEEAAHRLFDILRRLDDEGMDVIFSEVLPPEGVGLAVMNRLGRAAAFHRLQAEEVLAPAKYGAVLFDLDGTLTNTLRDIANAMNHALRQNGLPEWPAEAYRYLVGNGARKLAERAVRDRQDLQEKVQADYQAEYETHSEVFTRPYPGVPELLGALAERGLRLCVLSNKPDADTRRVVAHYFPGIPFEVVQGQLPEVPVKPDPAAARHVAARMGIAPERFLYLGDTAVDMACARNAGMHPVGVLWGFREEQELREGGAEWIIRRPEELLSLLKG